MHNLDDYDYQIPLDRFKELLADDGKAQDGDTTHRADCIAEELAGPHFIEEFTELARSVLDENPNNISNPERISKKFIDLVNRAAEFYHKEECL
tara:strand:- start:242 stop:523 length:282 start_codon:yes stop_codon:yes gene_type:complete